MSEHTIRIITDPGDPAIAHLPGLFTDMHVGMASDGMRLRLAPDGARMWCEGVVRGSERSGRLVIAEADGVVVGFAHGAIKLAPEYLGGEKLGHVTHLYVRPDLRGSGIGAGLAAALHDWFDTRGVSSIELQVVAGNEGALRFWGALGYEVEIMQMRKG